MVTKGDRRKNYRLFLCKILRKGGEAMDFDYFYKREAERFNFLKVPEILVDGEEFKHALSESEKKTERKESIHKNIEKFKEMAKNSVSKDKIKNKQKEQSL